MPVIIDVPNTISKIIIENVTYAEGDRLIDKFLNNERFDNFSLVLYRDTEEKKYGYGKCDLKFRRTDWTEFTTAEFYIAYGYLLGWLEIFREEK